MHHEALVRVLHGRTHLLDECEPCRDRQRPFVAPIRDGGAIDILHGQKRASVIGGAAVEQARDVRMLERGEDLSLAMEARQHVVRIHTAPQHLDRHPLLEGPIVACAQIDRPHAATSELALDAKAGHTRGIAPRRVPVARRLAQQRITDQCRALLVEWRRGILRLQQST
jgi:hypothetical protein